MREARDLIKVKRVIESCETIEQCNVARRMVYAYDRFYQVVQYYLDRKLATREDMILYRTGGKPCE